MPLIKYTPIFQHKDTKTGDVHILGKRGKESYGYICYDKNGNRKTLIHMRSKDSARMHILKKTGIDPFEEVIIEEVTSENNQV